MNFQNWLKTFVEEKGIDLGEYVEGKDCRLQVGDVLSAMMIAPPDEQAVIKKTLIAIDFRNGSVMHFIQFAAKAIDHTYKIGMG